MLAIHPAQVDIINRAFVPTAAEIEQAERIVALVRGESRAPARWAWMAR